MNKMKKEVLDHWYQNYLFALAKDIDHVNISPRRGPYCNKYWEFNCRNCPIMKKTQRPYCETTPHDEVAFCRASVELNPSNLRYSNLQKAIKEEIIFLESL